MPTVTTSLISFSLVAIPVSLHTAIRNNDIHLNQLHKDDHERIKYKKVCAHCGKSLADTEIVRGYEYNKDKYIVITDAEIEKIKTKKEKSIQILHFAQLDQISPIYYDKTYQAIPEAGGEKAFELFRKSLMDEQKIAIGKTVMGTKDTLLAIIPREDGMLLSKMFYSDEIKDLQKPYTKATVTDSELDMARALIKAMDVPFNPEAYVDEYNEKMRALVQTKIEGKEVVAVKSETEPRKVMDLMELLKSSVDAAQKGA